MFKPGFLGTRAPFFMDSVTLIVALLPFLVAIATLFAHRASYKMHALLQTIIFLFSLLVVGYFEYGVRLGRGFSHFAPSSNLSPTLLKSLLIVHITIATLTLLFWGWIVFFSLIQYKKKRLPGLGFAKHKTWGKRVFFGITLTTISGIALYLTLFLL